MLHCDIITIFPEFFRAAFEYGIIRRARAAGLVETTAHDLRGWTEDIVVLSNGPAGLDTDLVAYISSRNTPWTRGQDPTNQRFDD